MKRLRTHGLIKKIGKTYKYYLTTFGKQVLALGLKLKNLFVIPELSKVTARGRHEFDSGAAQFPGRSAGASLKDSSLA
jgi:hypothetical protein